MTSPTPSRRGLLTGAAALAAAGYAAPAFAGDTADAVTAHGGRRKHVRLTILGTTDLHGHALNWDYYKNTEYDDAAHNDVGLAKVQTLLTAMREHRAGEPVLTLDARRHHPGHAAGLLLRQGQADHRGRHPPDGHGHEPDGVRRRHHRQP